MKMKEKLNDYELFLKHNKTNFLIFGLVLIIDLLLLFYFVGGLTEGKFLGFYALHAFITSNIFGVLATLLACNITKNDYGGRQFLEFLVIGKLIINLLSNVIGVLANPNWHTSDGEKSVFQAFILVAVIALVAYAVQLYLCFKLLNKYKSPKKSKNTTSSNTNNEVIVTDRVKDTKFYKDNYDKYYNQYMGFPPKEKAKEDYSDIDSHDYSDIFKDKNF